VPFRKSATARALLASAIVFVILTSH
jgi:hypothetical protein